MSQPVPLHELVARLGLVEAEHIRTVPCACGGYITADRRHPFLQVARHNRTVEHQSWWALARIDWQGEP